MRTVRGEDERRPIQPDVRVERVSGGTMETVVELRVPLQVEARSGPNWMETK